MRAGPVRSKLDVWQQRFTVVLGASCLRLAVARPQLLPNPSGLSGPGSAPGSPVQGAGMAPAPFSAAVPAPVPAAAPAPASVSFVPILQQQFEQAPDGQYRWSYAAGDGTAQEAIGELTAASRAIAVQGSYSYPSPEGQVQVKYVADEFGFQPTGAHIHPAILEAVRRQVEKARAEPPNLYNESGFLTNGQQMVMPQGGAALPLPLPPPSALQTSAGSGPSGPALL
ncbi:endocuticle structural glycoprotein SgAbd-8-like [Frankliniella occidentalis]|uniref:Endocuticle structural glycoprotein SgAbd-8-like n=1 Tax=Frankliniella occidentalis TaxID=133901 RepID=A0A9C6WZ82_FRAOC|nr:endocuticle structural glycoprotein SgAbd-8-like [Frankliniella occidentalis]